MDRALDVRSRIELVRIDETRTFGEGEFIVGLRFGLSVYVP